MAMKKNSLGLATIIGILATGLGIVVPIIWDYYKTKTALELRQTSNSIVVSSEKEIDKLQFIYANNPVPGLSRIGFELVNTGRTPILNSDVIAPISIKLNDAKILDVVTSKTSPENLTLTHEISEDKTSFSIVFPLLNPGDSAHFTVLAATDQAKPTASARIAGLNNLTFTVYPEVIPNHKEKGMAFYIVSAVSVFATFILIVGLYMTGSEVTISRLTQLDILDIPLQKTAHGYALWMQKVLGTDKASDLKRLELWLATFPQDEGLTEEQVGVVRSRLRETLMDVSAAKAVLSLFGFLAFIGNAYIIYRLW